MKLPRIDEAISVCQHHLNETASFGTEIEAFLTRYLLILMCATFEEAIEEIIVDRIDKYGDPKLSSFVKSCLGSVFRSVKTSEIAGLLGRFGIDFKQKFNQRVNGTRAETFFNNIVINRHYTAHESGANITFNELVNSYEEGHVILDILVESL